MRFPAPQGECVRQFRVNAPYCRNFAKRDHLPQFIVKKDHLRIELTKKTTYSVAAAPPGDTWSLPPEAVAAASCRRPRWRHVSRQRSPSGHRRLARAMPPVHGAACMRGACLHSPWRQLSAWYRKLIGCMVPMSREQTWPADQHLSPH
jgi:hypothetical protein